MNEFVEYLKEVFVHFGAIEAKKMFGGYGIYHKGTMFGLVAQETLYLKVSGDLIKSFEARGLGPFEYDKGNKVIKMSYYLAPDEILDDPDEAAIWAKRSYEAAIQAKTKNKRNSFSRTK
ncbi:MAG: hypothetical protein NPIRA04_14180 [Nitrospirales bacterium]|nr:MAG: hypothetical protein NPIRA04_14180 [Nitrospirales bacterium]